MHSHSRNTYRKLKQVILKVHPDKFSTRHKERKCNEKSLQNLLELVEHYKESHHHRLPSKLPLHFFYNTPKELKEVKIDLKIRGGGRFESKSLGAVLEPLFTAFEIYPTEQEKQQAAEAEAEEAEQLSRAAIVEFMRASLDLARSRTEEYANIEKHVTQLKQEILAESKSVLGFEVCPVSAALLPLPTYHQALKQFKLLVPLLKDILKDWNQDIMIMITDMPEYFSCEDGIFLPWNEPLDKWVTYLESIDFASLRSKTHKPTPEPSPNEITEKMEELKSIFGCSSVINGWGLDSNQLEQFYQTICSNKEIFATVRALKGMSELDVYVSASSNMMSVTEDGKFSVSYNSELKAIVDLIEKNIEEAVDKSSKAARAKELQMMIKDELKLESLMLSWFLLDEKIETLERFCKLLPALKNLDFSGLSIYISNQDSEIMIDEAGRICIPENFSLDEITSFLDQNKPKLLSK